MTGCKMNNLRNKKIEISYDYKSKLYGVWLIEGKNFKTYLFTLEEKELKNFIKNSRKKKEGIVNVYSK